MRVTIGCPVRSRQWIIQRWFAHCDLAAEVAGVDVDYVFVVGDDDPTRPLLEAHPNVRLVSSGERPEADQRMWNKTRYRHMAIMRNWLLAEVRRDPPDYFLSLDSDILLHEDTLKNLLETAASGWDVVGGKCWMTDHTDACSYIQLVNTHGWIRPDVNHVTPVDIVMAIKLMSPAAYNVDYVFDGDGEDVGWSRGCVRAGLKLAFDGRVCNKHVMGEFDNQGRRRLDLVDPRCGF